MSDFDPSQLFNLASQEAHHPAVEEQFPLLPLNAPEMPLPGIDFINAATSMGDDPPVIDGKGRSRALVEYGPYLAYLHRRALYDAKFALPILFKRQPLTMQFVPGHIWQSQTSDFSCGPRRARVMLIGKCVGDEEVSKRRNFVGPASVPLYQCMDRCGIPDHVCADWYVTNLIRWAPPAAHSGQIPADWVRDCLPLLHQELRLVRPDYILCLGSDASKALLGKPYSVTNMAGRVVDYGIPIYGTDETPEYHTAKVMTSPHPASVWHNTTSEDEFRAQIELFWSLVQGANIGGVEEGLDHKIIDDIDELTAVVDAAIEETTPGPGKPWHCNIVAVDAEWHGDYATEPGSYLRTIQVSWRHKQGICVVLRSEGGAEAFRGGIPSAIDQLRRLLTSSPDREVRVGGHAFRSDLPWLLAEGLDLLDEYTAPKDIEGALAEQNFEPLRMHGGWDTILMHVAVNETGVLKLEDMAMRLIPEVPRWDEDLMEWRKAYCSEHDLSESDLEGYGECPSEVLYPYGIYDADATRRLAILHLEAEGLLDRDEYGNPSWQPYWLAHSASPTFLEMEMQGILVDMDRVDELVDTYSLVADRLLESLRAEVNWPTFNPQSPEQCCALLFGPPFDTKIDGKGEVKRIAPEDVILQNLEPLTTTSKPKRQWAEVVANGETGQYSPSTDKEVLGALGQSNAVAAKLRDVKFVQQVLKMPLRRPEMDDEGEVVLDENGRRLYRGGMLSYICSDGRVHTHLHQTKETGRLSSSRPPCQNISKRREDDYRRILGSYNQDGEPEGKYVDTLRPMYHYPLRSFLRASPGHVLVECDFTGAELAILAWMSQDPNMIEHVRRNALPDDDPDHYDMHSQAAVQAFQLTCPPTKKGLKQAGKAGLRVAAKNVNFGIPYGRGANALARQCAEEGIDVDPASAQRLIDAYFERYPLVADFLEACRKSVLNPGWMVNCFGRRRRFPRCYDESKLADQQRQAQNFPIQSAVADAMNIALANLWEYRHTAGLPFRFLLQIHDAVLLEVPIHAVEAVVNDVLPLCMQEMVPIIPCHLDGSPMPHAPSYQLGIDTDLSVRWGEKITDGEAEELSLNLDAIDV